MFLWMVLCVNQCSLVYYIDLDMHTAFFEIGFNGIGDYLLSLINHDGRGVHIDGGASAGCQAEGFMEFRHGIEKGRQTLSIIATGGAMVLAYWFPRLPTVRCRPRLQAT